MTCLGSAEDVWERTSRSHIGLICVATPSFVICNVRANAINSQSCVRLFMRVWNKSFSHLSNHSWPIDGTCPLHCSASDKASVLVSKHGLQLSNSLPICCEPALGILERRGNATSHMSLGRSWQAVSRPSTYPSVSKNTI